MCPVLRMAITLRWVIVVRSLFLWTRNDAHNNVILNEVKNLKVSETVDGSVNLEMLRFRSA